MGNEIPHRHGELNIQGYGLSVSLAAAHALQPAEVRKAVTDLVSSIAARCTSMGALTIGHVKAILKAEDQFINADTIGERYGTHISGTIYRPVSGAVLTVNSIIVGLDAEVIEHLTLEAIKETFESCGFKITLEQDGWSGNGCGHKHEDGDEESHYRTGRRA